MAVSVLFRHPSSLEHDTGSHPENARRIVAIERALGEREWLGWDVRLSPAATREQIAAVHPPEHIDRIERLCLRGGGMIDMDTLVSPGSFEAALHAAGRRRGGRGRVAGLGRRAGPLRRVAASPAGTSRRARAGDGLLPVRQRRDRRRSTRSTRTARGGC